ncbi:hypothetical protein HO173_002316 [Letharia columbiana]|uniref:Amino acid transporter transmembrane domain-containing protein n=1 Tax=Letharia columbiana TaxID=112416 RepID=A0A8H6G3L6_9LECA|nr:uncharacterized protein HO173_002316 [Letharia columbiana]KAF6239770.1 hypothetical protein HO173_002316 [Letharia columbiana]
MAQLGAMALDGGDPRLADKEGEFAGQGIVAYTRPQMRALHDKSITFEEYHYYALQSRAEEDSNHRMVKNGAGTRGFLSTIIPGKGPSSLASDEKRNQSMIPADISLSVPDRRASVTEEEWTNASRAVRTATAGAIFFLITTDILGPFGLPYAFATTGWGPGVALYTVFGFMAGVSGWLLWSCFMGLDSYQYPVKTYGDLAFRLYGQWARYMINILQSIQLICSVAVIIISNGEALSEASKFKLCYAICCLVWALAGFFLGQVRTLQKFGWLANFAIWINLLIMFITMGVAAHSPPLYSAAGSSAGFSVNPDLVTANAAGVYPAVTHSAGLPDPANFGASINGLMQAVYAYGGAMLFTEFMSEMKRPYDFLKGMWGAQFFIYIFYMLYGLFMYGYQGQYLQNPSYLGISPYNWQTAGNVLAMVSALIAAALYGNIGVKVLYNNIAVEFFRAPPLTNKKGKLLWVAVIPIYWSIAFIIGAAIPDFSGFTAIISAVCTIQFTYSFPPLPASRLQHQEKRPARRRGLRPRHRTGELARHGLEEADERVHGWELVFECLERPLPLRRAGDGRVGDLGRGGESDPHLCGAAAQCFWLPFAG